jgi:hypothetical protein
MLYCIGFFFLPFSLLIVRQISIWNYCKTFLSLLYNFLLLWSWWLCFSIVFEVFLQPFLPDISPSRMFTTNSLCLIICPIHECRLFFKISKLHCLIQTSMWLASLDTNVCSRKIQYLLVYILDIVILFIYNGLHYVRQSDIDAT